MTALNKEQKNLNFPTLRFPEFTESWEVKRLGECVKFKRTNSLSRENLNYSNGEVKNIHYGDIHKKFSILLDVKKENIPYINSEILLKKISKESYCKEGDLIFADASEDLLDVGKSIEIVNLNNEKVLSGLHTILARPIKFFSKGFLGYLLKSKKSRYLIQRESQGTKVLSINAKRLSKIELDFPTITEQTKIATFLSKLDERIDTQMKIVTHLETLIKGYRQKLFSQELRFKDDNGNDFPDWEEKRLGEISIKQSSNISANSIDDNNGNYIIYGATGVLKKINFYEVEQDYISIVKDGAGVGRLTYCKSKSSVLGTLDIIIPKENINTYFLYLFLNNINFVKYTIGSTIPHIYYKDYKNEKLKIPHLSEQEKIEDFLSKLDTKMEKERQLLTEYQQQKKYFLQHLFI